MAEKGEFDEGITLPTLINHLRSILHQYPDDGQILKELLQNAEDAGAKKVIFMLDSTTYPSNPGGHQDPDLAQYQGPALYVYNDAMFSKDDWRGIRMLSDSVKQKDPMKVGRFGLGFKSVFHITDLPSFFSGNGIGFLDPHERIFKTVKGHRTSSYFLDLKQNEVGIEQLQDQFLPYYQSLLGVTKETFERGSYEGTMFRFPLRMKGMKSDLCDTKYSPEKVRELFQSLKTDAHIMLLFLKSLESIEVYEKTSNSGEPTKLLSINISEALRQSVQEKRLQFINDIKNRRNGNNSDSTSVTYSLDIELKRYKNTMAIDDALETSKWIISQYFAGREELGSVNAISDDLGLLPWVGVALPVTDHGKSEIPSYLVKPKGHIFCFLPLPLEEESPTGLRVHVHGYFAVDSNRRHIKWPTADQNMDQLTDKALIWNAFLVNKLVAKALINLALHVSSPSSKLPCDLVFNIIPDQVTPQWKRMAEMFFKELPNLDVFYSQTSDGKWMNCRNVLFDNREDKSDVQELIRKILMMNQIDFTSVPLFLEQHFDKRITSEIVCDCLRTSQEEISLDEEERFLLLEQLLDKLSDWKGMMGVRLLPLADGSWTEFHALGDQDQDRIFIDSDAHSLSLFPGLERLFLRKTSPVSCRLVGLVERNLFQLAFLNAAIVPQLLDSVFPSHWKNTYKVQLSEAGNLSVEWIERLWRYLANHFPSDLSSFEAFHILPLDQGHLAKLQNNVPVVISSHSGYEMNTEMRDLLEIFGIVVIEKLPLSTQAHPLIFEKYVSTPDALNVLRSIDRLQKEGLLHDVGSLVSINGGNKILQRFLASGLAGKKAAEIDRYKELLQSLPIFETLDGWAFQKSHFVSLSEVALAAPVEFQLPISVPCKMIDLRENLTQALAIKVGVQTMSSAQILERFVFPAIARGEYVKNEVESLVCFIFDNFAHFSSESSSFTRELSGVRFLEKASGDLVSPPELFDHNDQVLRSLLSEEDVFSVGLFCDSKYTHFLHQLGIKGTDALKASDLLHVAKTLDSSETPDELKAYALIEFLDRNSHLLQAKIDDDLDTLLTALKQVRWVKCESKRPENYPKSVKYGEDFKWTTPSGVYPFQYGLVIGSIVPTLDVTKTPNVARCFKWDRKPTIDLVIRHLRNLINHYEHLYRLEYPIAIREIYKALNEMIETAEEQSDLKIFKEVPWVWHGDGFAMHTKVVKAASFADFRPYSFQLPEELKEFAALWSYFNLQDTVDLVQILNDVQMMHESEDRREDEIERDLKMVISILETVSTSDDKHEIVDQLLVPVQTNDGKLRLKNIIDVTYTDQDTVPEESLGDTELFLVHKNLRVETAKALNIHGIVNRMLGTEDLDFQSFGQKEPLTTRLSNLLRDYPDGLSVIKELIQNADDAGAKEVRFLYDERMNEDASRGLIDRGMEGVQGPALWAFNDAVFTDDDFRNLIKLSGATKERQRNKIGRFGLGFNAVYNLTDVPSLISRNHIVFLDPHTTHLGQAIRDKDSPGIKLDIHRNRERLKLLKGQFKPYNGIFGCDLGCDSKMKSYPGTLFRFPLRTKSQAVMSEISQKYYNKIEVFELLQLLSQSSDSIILFTQHVEKISVFHLKQNATSTNEIDKWLFIDKTIERSLRYLNDLSSVSSSKSGSILESANQIMDKMSAERSVDATIAKVENSAVIEVTSTLLNDSIKPQNSGKENKTYWLVSSCLGTLSSMDFALKYPEKGLIPVGGVAAKLQKTESGFEPVKLNSSVDTSGNDLQRGLLFCFLPLPIKTTFPVHINGSFSITSSRMHLCEATVSDKTDVRCQWNEVLIDDAVMRSYIVLLTDILTVCPGADPYALWPVHKSLQEVGLLSRLSDSLYNYICSANGPKIVQCSSTDVANRLVSFCECLFLEPMFRHGSVGRKGQKIFAQLKKSEAIDLPRPVIETILQSSAKDHFRSRMISTVHFFKDIFIPSIDQIEEDERDELAIFALFESDLIHLFRDVSFFPVQPSQELRKCIEMVSEKSDLAVLYDLEDAVFPSIPENCTRSITDLYSKLLELGMKESDLSWKDIADRCKVIPNKPELASKRLPIIMKLMDSKVASNETVDFESIENIKKIRFLPTLVKPQEFPLKWKGDEIQFASCEESYLSQAKYLVCCSRPIIDECRTFNSEKQKLKSVLGLSGKIAHEEDLLSQLQHAISLSDSQHVMPELSRASSDYVKHICSDVYEYLNRILTKSILSQQFVDTLCSNPSILVAGSSVSVFMRPDQCARALAGYLHFDSLLPYVCQIPHTLNSLSHLLNTLSIRNRFNDDDYLRIIQTIYSKYQKLPCDKNDLEVVLKIVSSCLSRENMADLDLEKLYLPNQSGVLIRADEICYSDATWDFDDMGNDEDEINICHERITSKISKDLGLKTIRDDFLDKYSYESDFGQSERLIDRINRILTGYDFNDGVFKEMLQNADDAGATEIHFINCKRHLPDKRVFQDKWKPLQGPALCVFNNKPFSKADLKGIQSLGKGSKSDELTKTGQYGVGFNCVYHLTDAPCLLTSISDGGDEKVLCVCDPSCSFVPRATKVNPGRMFKGIDKLKRKFPDVLEGFHEKKYQARGGTMFRLPLRTGKLTQNSKITNTTVDNQKVHELFETFKINIFEMLLFVHSLEEIHLIDMDERDVVTREYVIKAILSPGDKKQREKFEETVKRFAKDLKDKRIFIQEIPSTEISYELVIQDSEGRSDRWYIIQRFGFEKKEDLAYDVREAYTRGEIGLLPRAGIAYRLESSRKVSSIVDSSFAVQSVDDASRLFCFLPLPVKINFPVHVNGHFALEYETRMTLRFHERGGIHTAWNMSLMTNLVAPSYCSLLQQRRDIICQKENGKKLLPGYHELFPVVPVDDVSYIKTLCMSIYSRIQHENLAVLPVKTYLDSKGPEKVSFWLGPRGTDDTSWRMWSRMGWTGSIGHNNIHSYFCDSDGSCFASWFASQREERSLDDTLLECGFMFNLSPMDVFIRLQKGNVTVQKRSPEAVLAFFSTYSKPKTLCLIKNLPKPIDQTPIRSMSCLTSILRYCYSDDLTWKLRDLPLEATEDEYLRCFDRNPVKFEPSFKDLAPRLKAEFLHKEVFGALPPKAALNSFLCRKFTINDFARVIDEVLPSDTFKGKERVITVEQMRKHFEDPTLRWLNRVWEFLQSEDQIGPLTGWCLLPARICEQRVLLPIHKYNCITKFNRKAKEYKTKHETTYEPRVPSDVQRALVKIGISEPDTLLTDYRASEKYNSLLDEATFVESIVQGIIEAVKFKSPSVTLASAECTALLNYLSSNSSSCCVAGAIPAIKQLPIFTTVYDQIISLANSAAYIIPNEIPKTDMDAWKSTKSIVFLKGQSEKIDSLLKMLGCCPKSITDLYCEFIFRHFELLTPHGRLDHLKFVKEEINLNTDRRLLDAVRRLAFLPDPEGNLRPASEFYDKTNPILAVMEDPKDFPSKPYDSSEWKEFLVKCGMVSTVTEQMFLKYARLVEQCALVEVTGKLCEQSKVLVTHVCKRDFFLSDESLENLKTISFVCQFRVSYDHSTLHSQHGDRDHNGSLRFITFRGAALSIDAELVWTAQRILPSVVPKLPTSSKSDEVDTVLVHRFKKLEIQEVPTCKIVVEHISNLCTKWVSSMQDFEAIAFRRLGPSICTFRTVMIAVYQFLKNNFKSIGTKVHQILCETPFILDRQRYLLLRPENTVERLFPKDEIVPYLVHIPKDLEQFAELFKGLGASEEPTLDQYVMVLDEVFKASKGVRLGQEYRQSVVKVTTQLFKLLSESREPVHLNRTLYLLGTDDVMYRSCDLVVDNNFAIRERANQLEKPFLIDIQKECNLAFSNWQLERIVGWLPACQQPSLLTAVVKEEIEKIFPGKESTFAARIQIKLRSEELKFGLVRLAHHRIANAENFEEERLHDALKRLQDIRVIGVDQISCYLVYKGIRIEGSERQHSHFIEQYDKTSWKIFIDESKLKESFCGEEKLFIQLVNVFQSIIGDLPEHSIAYVSCILRSEMGSVDEILDEFGVERFTGRLTRAENQCSTSQKQNQPSRISEVTDESSSNYSTDRSEANSPDTSEIAGRDQFNTTQTRLRKSKRKYADRLQLQSDKRKKKGSS